MFSLIVCKTWGKHVGVEKNRAGSSTTQTQVIPGLFTATLGFFIVYPSQIYRLIHKSTTIIYTLFFKVLSINNKAVL